MASAPVTRDKTQTFAPFPWAKPCKSYAPADSARCFEQETTLQIDPSRIKPFEPVYYVIEDRVESGRLIRFDPLSPYFTTLPEAKAEQKKLIECGHSNCYVTEGKSLR